MTTFSTSLTHNTFCSSFLPLLSCSYEDRLKHVEKLVPYFLRELLIAGDGTNIDWWNDVNKDCLHIFLFSLVFFKAQHKRKIDDAPLEFKPRQVNRIIESCLSSLVVSEANTALLNKVNAWTMTTILMEYLRSPRITPKVIRMLMIDHGVDIYYIGGYDRTNNKSWNENACFLITRNWLRTGYNPVDQENFTRKMASFIQAAMIRKANMQRIFRVTSVGENNQSALDLILRPESKEVIDAERSASIKSYLQHFGFLPTF